MKVHGTDTAESHLEMAPEKSVNWKMNSQKDKHNLAV